MSHRVVTVGELTLDDVIYEGSGCHWGQLGGGALYSAIGALTWGADVAISSVVGADYPESLLEQLRTSGIDTSPIGRINANSLGLWLLYERDGRRHQVEKESGSSFATLDNARTSLTQLPSPVDGIHIAPQTTEGQMRALSEGTALTNLITQDLLIEPFISTEPYRNGTAMQGTTAFLPSQQEVEQLWGDTDVRTLWNLVHERSGVDILVVKRGPDGSDVATGEDIAWVPTAVEQPVDPTGAGDAFCGGFIVGLLETGDPIEASVKGAVSAALVVETHNAAEALDTLDPDQAQRRAERLRQQLQGAT